MTNQPSDFNEELLPEEERGFTVTDPDDIPPQENTKKHCKPRTRGQKVRRVLLIILCVILALLVALGATFFILYKIGERKLLGYKVDVAPPTAVEDLDTIEDDGSTVTYKGVTYEYNTDSVNILIMGLDKKNAVDNGGYGKNGQADVLMLLNLDVKTGAINILPISRETMTDVCIYTENGYAGMRNLQICLSYAYGKDGKESCENVCAAVRSLLYNIEIDSYTALDLDGLVKLTDAIGGVTLTPIETISNGVYSVTKGKKVTLKGKLADFYVHSRDNDLLANDRRMARQKQFLQSFASTAGNQILSKPTRLKTLYNKAKPYTVSNLTLDEITFLSTKCLTTNVGKSIVYHSVEGIHQDNKETGYTEFIPDETSLWEAVLATCYRKK